MHIGLHIHGNSANNIPITKYKKKPGGELFHRNGDFFTPGYILGK